MYTRTSSSYLLHRPYNINNTYEINYFKSEKQTQYYALGHFLMCLALFLQTPQLTNLHTFNNNYYIKTHLCCMVYIMVR